MKSEFNLNLVIENLKKVKKVFTSEAEFQLEMAVIIRKLYPNAKVLLEYNPIFDTKRYIDILVILENKYYPIELKYKTKECSLTNVNPPCNLKEQSAKNENCYRYLQDILRIEKFRDNEPLFEKGYTVFLTNDKSYQNKPRANSAYEEFSIHDGALKTGSMNWKPGSAKLNDDKFKSPIVLKGKYTMIWQKYSELDNDIDFFYLINEICK